MAMKKIVIDTNIYSSAFFGKKEAVRLFQDNKKQLIDFLLQERVREIPITSETSSFYAMILSNLKKQGTPIPTNDIWIAASAMENGAALASYDKHFKYIKGLILLGL